MPELPEVETVRVGLSQYIIGKAISRVIHDWDKSFPNAKADVEAFLIGAKITNVRRRAKVLLIDLSSEHTLVIHLKMTGQLVYRGSGEAFGAGHPNRSLVGGLPDKSTRVTFTFTDGSRLFFNDQRKFGWVRLIATPLILAAFTGSVLEANARKQRAVEQAVQQSTVREPRSNDAAVVQERLRQAGLSLAESKRGTDAVIEFMQRVGPEPLSADFTQADFRKRFLRRPNTNIKAALLDQSVIAGVGNIYADESLWGAKIHPATLVKNVPIRKMNKLYDELRFVLNLAIEKGGSSDRNYVNAEGKRGSYLSFARVFRRENQTCPRCDTTIIKIRVAGRGTHICPKCQKA